MKKIINILYNRDNKIKLYIYYNKSQKNKILMETLEKIKTLSEELSVNVTKFYKGNNSAGTRARKTAQDITTLLKDLRKDILSERKKEK